MRYVFADCLLDTQCHLLHRAGQSMRLRPKVFQALLYLLTHRDRVIPKQELCAQVWAARGASDATIDNCLRAIRHAIGDTGQAQRLIETRYGVGYRFVAAVTRSPDAAAPSRKTRHAYVILDEDGAKSTKTFTNACIAYDTYNHRIMVHHLQKDGSLGSVVAQFSEADVSSWYQDDEDEDEAVSPPSSPLPPRPGHPRPVPQRYDTGAPPARP
jgi:DNA-binding winged helix-turn-helix (wHTH) protein